MNEKMERSPAPEMSEREHLRHDIIALATELVESAEIFPFPGITAEARTGIENDETTIPGYSQFATPLADLLPKFEAEGMRIVFGTDQNSGNVFIIPAATGDMSMDNLFLYQLKAAATDERVQRLILMSQHYKNTA